MSTPRHGTKILPLAIFALLPGGTPLAADAQETLALYTPLATANRARLPSADAAYAGRFQAGGAYTSDDNYMFGQYNGLEEEGLTIIGDLQWQDFSGANSYWQASFSDLGLDTREGRITWGRPGRMRVVLGLDSQKQVRNDTGRTPFLGAYNQTLPDNWVTGIDTSDFAALQSALRGFDRELERDRISLAFDTALADSWRLRSNIAYEEKEGRGDIGAGIYIDGASADAVLLRKPVDQAVTEVDLGLTYEGGALYLDSELAYSTFDNDEDELVWQNPYSSFGERVGYPAGTGGLGLLPDNEQLSGRLVGHWLFSPQARFQFDGSYALASQDQRYLDYTVNDALVVTEPLPARDLDGEVASGTFNGKLLLMPTRRLSAELFYKLRDRDYDVDRNGYLYVRGDGGDQPDAAQTVYNTAHDLTSQTAGAEVSYRLPLRSKLTLEYTYEDTERRNAAVEKSEEDRYSLTYRIQPWSEFSARLHFLYADRAADTYEWAQSYFALLDAELINATPDSQRYLNHPGLFQYHLANRERYEGKLNLSYLPAERWNLSLNLSWRYDDYDQTQLGLTESEWIGGHFSASYALADTLTASLYTGYDRYDGNQSSRAFRGGQEKNAFEIFPPLPQASDPNQDWDLDSTDHTVTAGLNLNWRPAKQYELALDYSFVDTRAEQELDTLDGASVAAADLPDVDTRSHRVEASGTWHVADDVSLRLDYRFFSYESDDWAWDNVQANTLDKVLTFGQDNPDEDIHYVGISAIYRWR